MLTLGINFFILILQELKKPIPKFLQTITRLNCHFFDVRHVTPKIPNDIGEIIFVRKKARINFYH